MSEALLRVWLDDDLVDRAAPEGWIHVTTAWDAIDLLKTRRVVELSLDHDLSDDERFGRGVDVVDFIAEQQEVHGRDLWPRDGISSPHGEPGRPRCHGPDDPPIRGEGGSRRQRVLGGRPTEVHVRPLTS